MATAGGRDRVALRAGMPSRENPLTPVPATELMTGPTGWSAGTTKLTPRAALTPPTATMAEATATMIAVRRQLPETADDGSMAVVGRSAESIAGAAGAGAANSGS